MDKVFQRLCSCPVHLICWKVGSEIHSNLVGTAVFLYVSKNFNDISQENKAPLGDVYRLENLLGVDGYKMRTIKIKTCFKPLTHLADSDSLLRFTAFFQNVRSPFYHNR